MASLDSLVNPDWLSQNLHRSDIKVIDGTWSMPGDSVPLPGQFIPGAQAFDIDEIADQTSHMAHMLPSGEIFATAMSHMDITNDDTVIIYDRHGLMAAPRVWWTFRMFGHENIAILDGGLPAWIKEGYETASSAAEPLKNCIYTPKPALSGVISQSEITAALPHKPQILDARPTGRFFGTSPEPRASLRSGHIPGSRSLPFGSLRTEDMRYKSLNELQTLITQTDIDTSRPVLTTCGSGVTAAGIAFALHLLGVQNVKVYDGSWAEWGASDAPISLD